MKLALAFAAALATTACVGVKFYRADDKGNILQDEYGRDAEIGLPFHESKPYLLVTRSGAKDGGVDSKIIYLPDMTTTYYAKPDPVLIGSSEFTLNLNGSQLTSFNGKVEADLPGLLANLVSPIKGLAEADASRAAAGLDDASAEQIRASIAQASSSSGIAESSGVQALLANPKTDACAINPTAIPPFNSQLNAAQAGELLGGIVDLACALKLYGDGTSNAQSSVVETAMRSLLTVYDKNFASSSIALALVILEKHPTADSLRALIAPLKDFDITPSEPPSEKLKVIEERVRAAYKRILEVADKIDPPKPAAPKDSYELYEIIMSPSGTTLSKVPKKHVGSSA